MYTSVIKNKKGSVLLYTMLIGVVLMSVAVYYMQETTKVQDIILVWNQNILANPQSSYEDAMLRSSKISSSELESTYETNKDDIKNNPFEEKNSLDQNTLSSLSLDLDDNIDNKLTEQSWLDRVVTSKFKKFFVLDTEDAPNKGKFVYEFTLDNSTPIDNLNFYWGSDNKSSDMYVLMTRFSKNDVGLFNLDEKTSDVQSLVNKQYGSAGGVYSAWDNTSVINRNYTLVKQNNTIVNSEDPEIPITYQDGTHFAWENEYSIKDLISWTNLDTQRYLYKIYVVFPFNIAGTQTLPFKVEAMKDWNLVAMGLNNFLKIDTTGMYRGVKSRIEITKSVDNNIIPYFIYWVYSNKDLKK